MLVNRSGPDVLGQTTFRNLGDLPVVPETVVVVTPPATVRAALEDALDAGARQVLESVIDESALSPIARARSAKPGRSTSRR